jgi:hypothetical protein
MVMPSASLTLGDKILIQMASGYLFVVSAFWYGHERIRSVGICYFPLAFALFCKYARPFASAETRARLRKDREEHEVRCFARKRGLIKFINSNIEGEAIA